MGLFGPAAVAAFEGEASDASWSQCLPEPHSTKQIEDCTDRGLDTTPETLILTVEAMNEVGDTETVAPLLRALCQIRTWLARCG